MSLYEELFFYPMQHMFLGRPQNTFCKSLNIIYSLSTHCLAEYGWVESCMLSYSNK